MRIFKTLGLTLVALSLTLPSFTQDSRSDSNRGNSLERVQRGRSGGNSFREKRNITQQFGLSRYQKELQRRNQQGEQVLSDSRQNPLETSLNKIPDSELRSLSGNSRAGELKNLERKKELFQNFKTPDQKVTDPILQKQNFSDVTSNRSEAMSKNRGVGEESRKYLQNVREDEAKRIQLVEEVRQLIKKGQLDPSQINLLERENFKNTGQSERTEALKKVDHALSNFRNTRTTSPGGLNTSAELSNSRTEGLKSPALSRSSTERAAHLKAIENSSKLKPNTSRPTIQNRSLDRDALKRHLENLRKQNDPLKQFPGAHGEKTGNDVINSGGDSNSSSSGIR